MCLYKPIPEVFCLFKSTRGFKGTIEGEMHAKWLSPECFKAKTPASSICVIIFLPMYSRKGTERPAL